MKKAAHYLSAMLMVACFTHPVSAQFEGKITYESYEYSSGGDEEKKDEFTMFVTPDRILLQGENKYEFMGSIKTEGVLVRLDFQDFVFLTGDDKALKISKTDITSMMKMFGSGNSAKVDPDGSIAYERTGETETISGYQCEKFIFTNEENNDGQTAVWMTKGIDIDWGMLAEPWGGQADELIRSEFPMDVVFKEKFFPVRVEAYENNQMVSKLIATSIDESSIARAMVQIPPGVKVLSFQDYLFQKMGEQ